jgi:biopolymer transport protein ExbD
MSGHKIKHVIGTPLKTRHSTPIHQPGKRLMHGIPLRFVQRKVSGGGHKSVNADLNLTSMIDYLVITVVFLLSQFGTQQEMTSQQGLEVPTVAHADALRSAPVLSISSRAIVFSNQPVASPEEIRGSAGDLPQLVERLQDARRIWATVHPNEPFEGDIVFQIDRNVDWELIKRLAVTCAHYDYVHLNFAVNKGSSND